MDIFYFRIYYTVTFKWILVTYHSSWCDEHCMELYSNTHSLGLVCSCPPRPPCSIPAIQIWLSWSGQDGHFCLKNLAAVMCSFNLFTSNCVRIAIYLVQIILSHAQTNFQASAQVLTLTLPLTLGVNRPLNLGFDVNFSDILRETNQELSWFKLTMATSCPHFESE